LYAAGPVGLRGDVHDAGFEVEEERVGSPDVIGVCAVNDQVPCDSGGPVGSQSAVAPSLHHKDGCREVLRHTM